MTPRVERGSGEAGRATGRARFTWLVVCGTPIFGNRDSSAVDPEALRPRTMDENGSSLLNARIHDSRAQVSKFSTLGGAHAATIRKRGADDAVLVGSAMVMDFTRNGASSQEEDHYAREPAVKPVDDLHHSRLYLSEILGWSRVLNCEDGKRFHGTPGRPYIVCAEDPNAGQLSPGLDGESPF